MPSMVRSFERSTAVVRRGFGWIARCSGVCVRQLQTWAAPRRLSIPAVVRRDGVRDGVDPPGRMAAGSPFLVNK